MGSCASERPRPNLNQQKVPTQPTLPNNLKQPVLNPPSNTNPETNANNPENHKKEHQTSGLPAVQHLQSKLQTDFKQVSHPQVPSGSTSDAKINVAGAHVFANPNLNGTLSASQIPSRLEGESNKQRFVSNKDHDHNTSKLNSQSGQNMLQLAHVRELQSVLPDRHAKHVPSQDIVRVPAAEIQPVQPADVVDNSRHERGYGQEQIFETYHQNFFIPVFEIVLAAKQ